MTDIHYTVVFGRLCGYNVHKTATAFHRRTAQQVSGAHHLVSGAHHLVSGAHHLVTQTCMSL